VRPSGGDGT